MMQLLVVLLTMLVLPAASVAWHWGSGESLLSLVGTWFLYWGAGARLAIAGARQILAPRFTADIFKISDERAMPLVQELGFWNLIIGVLCMASLHHPDWRLPLALAAGSFYAMAGIKHVLTPDRTVEGRTAMISDLAGALVLLGTVAIGLLA